MYTMWSIPHNNFYEVGMLFPFYLCNCGSFLFSGRRQSTYCKWWRWEANLELPTGGKLSISIHGRGGGRGRGRNGPQETMEGGGGVGKNNLIDRNTVTFVKFLVYCLTLRADSKWGLLLTTVFKIAVKETVHVVTSCRCSQVRCKDSAVPGRLSLWVNVCISFDHRLLPSAYNCFLFKKYNLYVIGLLIEILTFKPHDLSPQQMKS